MKLREDYANEIAVRATAHSIRSYAKGIEKEIAAIGTKTVEKFSEGYLKKLYKKADALEARAEELNHASTEELFIALETDKLDIQRTILEFVTRINKELAKLTLHTDKYDELKIKVMNLYNIDLFTIRNHHKDKKAQKIAEELYSASTLNTAAMLVRVHEAEGPAIQSVWDGLTQTTFIRKMVSERPNEKEFEDAFNDYTLSVVKPSVNTLIVNAFKHALIEPGEQPDQETLSFLEKKLPELVDKFFDPSGRKGTVGMKTRAIVYQRAVEVYKEID